MFYHENIFILSCLGSCFVISIAGERTRGNKPVKVPMPWVVRNRCGTMRCCGSVGVVSREVDRNATLLVNVLVEVSHACPCIRIYYMIWLANIHLYIYIH